MLLAVALILNGDIVLTGGRSDCIVHIHPAGAGHAIDTKNRVAGSMPALVVIEPSST